MITKVENVTWPAIVRIKGVEELLYVDSSGEWQSDRQFTPENFQAGDELIDSMGDVYPLGNREDNNLQTRTATLPLDKILDMVRQHASVCGHCCVSKMGASTTAEAIGLVREIE